MSDSSREEKEKINMIFSKYNQPDRYKGRRGNKDPFTVFSLRNNEKGAYTCF